MIRDIYEKILRPGADTSKSVALQKSFVVVLGFAAFMLIFIPTVMGWAYRCFSTRTSPTPCTAWR